MIQSPTVSVCMITYGHEKYIREAIEGVLMQECDFEVELILANDCSPDQTDSVIQDIMTNHPRGFWIKYIKQEVNIGMMPNFIFALQQAKGKYVIFAGSDDFYEKTYITKLIHMNELKKTAACQSYVKTTLKNSERIEKYIDISMETNKITLKKILFDGCFLFKISV